VVSHGNVLKGKWDENARRIIAFIVDFLMRNGVRRAGVACFKSGCVFAVKNIFNLT
jgi:hypothetical protein